MRQVLSLATREAIISGARLLAGAGRTTAVSGRYALIDLAAGDLVTRVEDVDGRRVGAAALPVQHFCLHYATKHVFVDLLLPFLCNAAIDRALIGDGDDIATSTAAAGVRS